MGYNGKYMQGSIVKKFRDGLTLLELMVVISVIGIITTAFVVTARVTYAQQLEDRAESFSRDVKYTRNLVSSRASYQFSGQTTPKFPDGGYGIVVQSTSDYYDIVAYKADGATYEVVKHVPFESTIDFRVDVTSPAQYNFFMRFLDENTMVTNMTIRYDNKYVVKLGNYACTGTCDRSLVAIAELAPDGNLIYNVAYSMTSEVVSTGGPTGGTCLVAGTKIIMADGSEKNIEEVKVGDIILSKIGSQVRSVEVLRTEAPMSDGYYIIRLKDGTKLRLTDEHPVYSRGKNWEDWASIEPKATLEYSKFSVKRLEAGAEVFSLNGWIGIEAIDFVPGKIKTFNLNEVEGNVFFADGVMVHNKGLPAQVERGL